MAKVQSVPYLSFFGLREAPFRLVPDTACFFTGAERGRTLQALVYAVTQGEGIVRIIGEVGAGKTMLCRMLLKELPPSVNVAYLAVPSLDRREVLRALARELQIASPPESDPQELLAALQTELIRRHAEGYRVALLVDEAHAMPAEALEQVRLLSNLETRTEQLLQIVLFGQPELDQLLARPELRALRDRIKHSFRLAPMDAEEVGGYLDLRLRNAGYAGGPLFPPASVRALTRGAGGLARRINILADRCLLAAYSQDSRTVRTRHVALALSDDHAAPVHRSPLTWAMLALGGVVGVALASLLLKVMHA